jgi:hypothetical protein
MAEEPIISAEVQAAPDLAHTAAKALQALGFRILRVDPLISVDGPKALWETVFGVTFEQRSEPLFPDFEGGQREVYTVDEDSLEVPEELRDFVLEVIFSAPPDLYDLEPPERQP